VQLRPRNNGTPGEGRGINTINWVPPLKDAAIRRTRTSPTLIPRKCEGMTRPRRPHRPHGSGDERARIARKAIVGSWQRLVSQRPLEFARFVRVEQQPKNGRQNEAAV
jgi:hypothetical protein